MNSGRGGAAAVRARRGGGRAGAAAGRDRVACVRRNREQAEAGSERERPVERDTGEREEGSGTRRLGLQLALGGCTFRLSTLHCGAAAQQHAYMYVSYYVRGQVPRPASPRASEAIVPSAIASFHLH